MKRLALTLLAAAVLAGCSDTKAPDAQAQAGTDTATRSVSGVVQTAPAADPAAKAASPVAAARVTGKVLETMDAAGYTYLRLQTADGEKWAAVSAASVKKGETVTIDEQMTAENFESKTLNRKFDKIIFGTVAGANSAPAGMMASNKMPAGHPPANAQNANTMGTPAQHMSAPDAGAIKVEKAEGADAKTVAEVWSGRTSLNNKPVVVRAKVVKFLGGIMGKNWLHVRDGSGTEGSNDLTVTTDDVVAVGDVVLVKGTVRADKDFGAGYKYAVIVEDAKITR